MTYSLPDNDDYKYAIYNDSKYHCEKTVTVKTLKPGSEYKQYLFAKKGDSEWYKINYNSAKTKPLNVKLKVRAVSASSIEYSVIYDKGDAEDVDQTIAFDKVVCKDLNGKVVGLKPNTSYNVSVKTKAGGYDMGTESVDVTTSSIVFENAPAKVINLGNVIISSSTNVDDEEENVGFEWRRQDWSDINPSNTGTAYLYEGKMEGYIRSLNTSAQWMYRPYYLANDGTYYYGDWMGFDPTNTSYFEATVHTYDKTSVDGNTALVKGYALRGTDAIKVQGFRYWKSTASAKAMAGGAPKDYMTVEVKGQLMETELTGLDYETTYCFQAFVETDADVFEGEIRTFTTGPDVTGIGDIRTDEGTDCAPVTEVARYDIGGRKIMVPQKGVNIVRMSDGSVKKVYVK